VTIWYVSYETWSGISFYTLPEKQRGWEIGYELLSEASKNTLGDASDGPSITEVI